MVLPAARAISPAAETPSFANTGRYRATRGTLEINWLSTILTGNITGIDVRSRLVPVRTLCTTPESHTLSMRMNIAAKNIRVNQSIFLTMVTLLELKATIGKAAARAI